MKWLVNATIAFLGLLTMVATPATAAEVEYPQIIRTRYEAVDQKTGGSFVIFSEREKIFYGLDPKLFPGARFVEVTQITPHGRIHNSDVCRDQDSAQHDLRLHSPHWQRAFSHQRHDA
jgi:hypothetical protein